MTARDTAHGIDTPSVPHHTPDDDYTREELAAMSRDQLDRLGAAYDDVEILHVAPGPTPGSRMERRAVRQVSFVFGLAGLFAFLFVFFYVGSGWFLPNWRYKIDGIWGALFTPFLGFCMGAALLLVGVGLVLFTKKLLPHETAVQQQHEVSYVDQMTTAATAQNAFHNSGLARRKMITRSLGLLGAGFGLMMIMPLGGLIKNPNKGNPLGTTPWGKGIRLLRQDGTPIRPGDQEPGSMETVFPGVPGGNKASDAATMLFRLRPEQLAKFSPRKGQENFGYGDYVAFSKICTHAGCPVSLYEQETSKILCPCHQSQFLITDDAVPVFGPATRPLPQLPITVDGQGYFVARGDYREAVGPTYWNRKRV